jgi:carbonic anhydrase
MLFEEILERNRAFVRDRTPSPLPPPGVVPLAVVACSDPRLDELLAPALGIEDGKAILLRSFGAVVAPSGDLLRSLALGVCLFGVSRVWVVGHKGCRMAGFESAPFIEAFRRRGVRREAFGEGDLRAWVGAIPDPKRGVLSAIAAITAAPMLPRDLAVGGFVLDEESGALEVVQRPGEAPIPEPPTVAAAPPSAVEPPRGAESIEPPRAPDVAAKPGPRAPGGAAHHPPQPPVSGPPPLGQAVRTLANTLSAARWREELRLLQSELDEQVSPLQQIALLENFVRKAAAESRTVGEAFENLKRVVGPAGRRPGPRELVNLFKQASREAES